MPLLGRVLRGPDTPAAQHPLVRGVGLWVLQPSRRPRTVLRQSPDPRRDCPALRTVASTARAAKPRVARPALSTYPLLTTPLRPRNLFDRRYGVFEPIPLLGEWIQGQRDPISRNYP